MRLHSVNRRDVILSVCVAVTASAGFIENPEPV